MKTSSLKTGKLSTAGKLLAYIQRSKMRSAHGIPLSAIPITKREKKELQASFGMGNVIPITPDSPSMFAGIDLYEHPDAAKIRGE